MADLISIFGGPFQREPTERPYVEPPEIQLIDAMRRAGLDAPPDIKMDGRIHRFNTGKRRDLSSWYIAYGDGLAAGKFGDWRMGIEIGWRAEMVRPYTIAEEMEFTRRMTEAKAARDEEMAKSRANVSVAVEEIFALGAEASPDHPYLKRKGIQPHGAKVTGDGRLMVPLYDADGSISSLQYISDDGDKKYHPGGATGSKCWQIGGDDSILYIAEGFATSATIHEETGKACVVAYSASNLVPIAGMMREKYGRTHQITIVADHDASGVGQRYAEQAAAKYGVRYVIPPVEGDANDLRSAGHDIRSWLEPHAGSAIYDRLKAVFASDLPEEIQLPDELIQGFMTIGSQAVLYGDSNSGKTFLALSIAACVSEGIPWFGRKVDGGLTIYLATESPASVRTRVQAIKRQLGLTLHSLVIVQAPMNFYAGDGDAGAVIELIRTIEAERGETARLIVGDTLARMSSGANENSGEDMGPVMARFDAVSRETGAAMLIIHHNGKNAAAGARGWSGIRAHIDTEIEVECTDDVRTATITKQRELSGKGDVIPFKLDLVPIGISKFGEELSTCVAVPDTDARVEKPTKESPIKKHQKAFETAWWGCGAEDREGRPYIARSSLKDYLLSNGYAQRTVTNILNPAHGKGMICELVAAGLIEIHEKHGWVLLDTIASFALIQRRDSRET